ncbi:sortase [Leucobacter weissii]|uniref:Sortase n=1 Tax=Leucobacter weissii TaxID=1983706 RepID=A0A939MQ14_9MICO|nr:sortase [Leucobacter weissii]MBO1902837.1 sortase [Leucobacter weissii]
MTTDLSPGPAAGSSPASAPVTGAEQKPKKPKPPLVLSQRDHAIRGVVGIAAALLLSFAFNLIVFSHLQYFAAQQQLRDRFSAELAEGVAPVSEGDFNSVLLSDGDPVTLLDIPSIGLRTVVVEGSSGGVTSNGPGHRRDTVLPGQAGVSIIMGRASAYGAPFSKIKDLRPGDTFTAITGQGEHVYSVIGVRYQKDPTPTTPQTGESRLILETARTSMPYVPTGVIRVDARLVSDVQDTGARQTTPATLPPSHRAMATDTSTVWALVFALQALIVLEVALVWSVRRVGARRAWAVFVPIALLITFIVTDQVMRLLPNLL